MRFCLKLAHAFSLARVSFSLFVPRFCSLSEWFTVAHLSTCIHCLYLFLLPYLFLHHPDGLSLGTDSCETVLKKPKEQIPLQMIPGETESENQRNKTLICCFFPTIVVIFLYTILLFYCFHVHFFILLMVSTFLFHSAFNHFDHSSKAIYVLFYQPFKHVTILKDFNRMTIILKTCALFLKKTIFIFLCRSMPRTREPW